MKAQAVFCRIGTDRVREIWMVEIKPSVMVPGVWWERTPAGKACAEALARFLNGEP